MIFARSTFVVAVLSAAFGFATPAAAQQSNTAVAVGAIDVSKVATQDGDDSRFQQLFAKWESADGVRPKAQAPAVSLPSRTPLDNVHLSSDYGMRTHPVLGGRRAHKGIDLSAPTGTPIYATADGVVSRAGPFSSYGNFVSIEHGASVETRYAHMSRVVAHTGDRVKKGDLIGYVGSTGRSTGAHLHYEVRVAGAAVNPIPYMNAGESQNAFALAMAAGVKGNDADEGDE